MKRNILITAIMTALLVGCTSKDDDYLSPQALGDLSDAQKNSLARVFAPVYFTDQMVDHIYNSNSGFYFQNQSQKQTIQSVTARDSARLIVEDIYDRIDREARCVVNETPDTRSFIARRLGIEYAGQREIYSRAGENPGSANDTAADEKCPLEYEMQTTFANGHGLGQSSVKTNMSVYLNTRGSLARSAQLVKEMELSGQATAVTSGGGGTPIQTIDEHYYGHAVVPGEGRVSIRRQIRREVIWQGGFMQVQKSHSTWEVVGNNHRAKVTISSEGGGLNGRALRVYVDDIPANVGILSNLVALWDRGIKNTTATGNATDLKRQQEALKRNQSK